jgi:hypothetical protein
MLDLAVTFRNRPALHAVTAPGNHFFAVKVSYWLPLK